MKGEGLVAIAIVVAVFGGPLYGLYRLVRRHTHPSRSLLLSFLATLAIVFFASLFAISIVVLIVPGIKALSGLVGLAAAALAWRYSRVWIAAPRGGNTTARGLSQEIPLAADRAAPDSRWAWPSPVFVNRWQIVCAASVVAIVGFLSIHRYEPAPGFVWNIIHAKIFLTRPCVKQSGLPDFSDLGEPRGFIERLWDGECGVYFPYSGLLATAVSMAAVALAWPHHKPHQPSTPSPLATSSPPPISRRGPPPIPPAT